MNKPPPRFSIDPDVTRAQTLDSHFYLDPAVYTQVREQVFARSWQWLGPLDDVAAPGSVAPHTLLPGLLDEPLLLARDGDGTLRCLSNVCTHRGKLLVAQAGPADGIRCGYHSRRFDLAGRLRFMPGFEDACNFPSHSDHLPQLPLQDWFGHGFVALDPATDFGAWMAPVNERLPWLDLRNYRADPSRSRSFEFDAHWALYVENYLEGLHIPFLHPGLNQVLDMDGYRYEQAAWANLQLARARDDEAAFTPPPGSPEHGQRIAAYYWWLFPNLMLNFYPWGLSLNLVQPLGPARTRVLFRSFVADASLLGQGAGGALDPVEMEDEAAVLSVQQGIRSRLYRRGRYSPQHERGVHQFHRLLAAALAASGQG
ncbi:MAG: aromatic ring-hydroxylating dioxygenase subunit alpha [Rubrivivax sp.]